jgi:uncharacterized protein (DUF1697 family)
MTAPKSPLVVFLRGVNVGGNKTFRPAELARALGAVNLGAAGTFVLHAGSSAGAVRKATLEALEFDAEVIVCPGENVVALARRADKSPPPYGPDLKTMVTVLAAKPKSPPRLPVEVPEGAASWQVRVTAVDGPFVTSLWRRREGRFIYPNEVVERLFGVPATTRGWTTIASIRKALEEGAGTAAKTKKAAKK